MMLLAQGFGQKALRRHGVLRGGEPKIERHARRIDCPVQVTSLAFDPDAGLVRLPVVAGRLEAFAQAPFPFRGAPLDPSPGRDVSGRNAAFSHRFLDVALREREA